MPREATLLAISLTLVAMLATATGLSMEHSTFDIWGAWLVAPVLIVLSLPAFARQAARESDRRIFWLLLFALLAKLLIGTLLRYYITVEINGGTDSSKYHDAGVPMAEGFRNGNFDTGLPSLTGTDFIRFLTGIVYTIIGPTRGGGFLVFSWLAFWGTFFFYRAFLEAVPEGRKKTYARFVFFLPSLLFWPSSIGKEAWMLFGLGIAAYGVARVLSGNPFRGLLVAGLGMWLGSLVRPYLPGMVVAGLGFAYILSRPGERLRQLAPIVKAFSLAILVVMALVLSAQTEEFLNERNVETKKGVTNTLGEVSRRSSQGGSEFTPTVLRSPVDAPFAFGTVLFRPLITEAHNPESVMAALEGMFLFLLTVVRLPRIVAALRNVRRHPYVLAAAVYTGLFVFGFSSLANFGQLARQRSLLFPFYVVLLCVPLPKWKTTATEAQVVKPEIAGAAEPATLAIL